MPILKFWGIAHAVLCIQILSPAQNIVYVDASASGAANGTSWKDAYVHFRDATDQLNNDPSTAYEVRVAEGTYYPTRLQNSSDRNASFVVVQHDALRRIFGGYPAGGGNRSPALHKTVFSGEIGSPDDATDNSRKIFLLGSPRPTADSLILDGVTITGGHQNYVNGEEYYIYTNALGDEIRIPQAQVGSALWLSTANGGKTQIRNCTIEKNGANVGSAVSVMQSQALFLNCIFSGNSGSAGGALLVTDGELKVEKSEFRNNAGSSGGAIFAERSSLFLSGSVLSGNFSRSWGGAIRVDNGDQLTVSDCMIANNGATGNGGAIHLLYVGKADFINSGFIGNKAASFKENALATVHGGAIFSVYSFGEQADPRLNFLNCTFSKNEAYTSGGLYISGSSVNLTDCEFSENVAYSSGAFAGGGIKIMNSAETSIKGCKVNKSKRGGLMFYNCGYVGIEKTEVNENTGWGASIIGGIEVYIAEEVEISDTRVIGNLDGGIFINKSKSTTIERTVVTKGRGLYSGIFLYDAPARLANSIISHNEAGNNSGVLCSNADTEIVNCLITSNRSLLAGGGLFNYNGNCNVYNSTLAKNSGDPVHGPTAVIHNGANGKVAVRNSIIWANDVTKVTRNDEDSNNAAGSISVVNSLVQGGAPGEGNIDADPLFVDPENDNFRLKNSSPAIDKGDATGILVVLGNYDLDNLSRINSTLDLGAYEFHNGTLPVRLVSFSAAVQEKVILLNWQTEREENLSFFEIERSPDAINWSKAGSVNKKEGNGGRKDYSFTDPIASLPLSGDELIPFYYRLRVVDLDGSVTYSRIVVVTLSRSDYILSVTGRMQAVKVYPNPSTGGKLEVELSGNVQEAAAFRITDLAGRELAAGLIHAKTVLDVSAFSPGVYLMHISAENGPVIKKVVIQ